jgi:hypothetical protein
MIGVNTIVMTVDATGMTIRTMIVVMAAIAKADQRLSAFHSRAQK